MLEKATTTCRKVLESGTQIETGQPSEQETIERELRDSFAISTFAMANAFTWVGKREEALPLLKEARDLFAKLRLEKPDHPATCAAPRHAI